MDINSYLYIGFSVITHSLAQKRRKKIMNKMKRNEYDKTTKQRIRYKSKRH